VQQTRLPSAAKACVLFSFVGLALHVVGDE
jgi:hypothetical protein